MTLQDLQTGSQSSLPLQTGSQSRRDQKHLQAFPLGFWASGLQLSLEQWSGESVPLQMRFFCCCLNLKDILHVCSKFSYTFRKAGCGGQTPSPSRSLCGNHKGRGAGDGLLLLRN